MIKPTPFRSLPLDHVAAMAGGAFAFDERAFAGEGRRKPTPERWMPLLAFASVVGLGGWLMRRLAA